MSAENDHSIQQQLRSPPSAAVAGIIFSILLITSMILLTSTDLPSNLTTEQLDTWIARTSFGLRLAPFIGIAFLWFTGVIRDLIGEREDQLFATVFFGSGIIFVMLLFIWAASFAAIIRAYQAVGTGNVLIEDNVFVFAFALMNEILGNYALRMAGVYMLSIGSLWTRTAVVPRWLTVFTYVVALGFVFFAGTVNGLRYIFPMWVLIVSIYTLVANYRRTHENAKP